MLEILLHLVKRQGIQRSGVKQFCLIFLHFVGYKTGHVRPHTRGVSMYSLTAERLSAKVKNSCNLFPPGAASAASGRPRVGPPTPTPRSLRSGSGPEKTTTSGNLGRSSIVRWRRVVSRCRVCSVVLQRAPLKRSIPRLALPWLPPPTTQKLGARPLQHDFAPHLPRPPYLALAPM